MKILFLTSNKAATKNLFVFLKKQKDIEAILFEKKLELSDLKEINPDLVVSYNYSFLVKQGAIDWMRGKIINLHISFLPYNRGADPIIWSILENTPSGVTIHLVDKGLDTGDIIFQKKVFIKEEDCLEDLYNRLQKEIQNLFIENFSCLKNWRIKKIKQPAKSTFHLKKDFESFKSILQPEGYKITVAEFRRRFNEHQHEN